MDMKRFSLYCVTGAVLALAGCNGGGGGGGQVGVAPTPSTPVIPHPLQNPVSLDDLLMGYMNVPAGTYTVNAGQTMDAGDATFSCPAGGETCVITVEDDGTVTSAGGLATAMPSPAAIAAQLKTNGIIKAIKEGRTFFPESGVFGTGAANRVSQVVVTPEVWDTSWAVLQGIAIGRGMGTSHPNTPNPLGDTLNQDDTALANTIEFTNQNTNTTLGEFAGEVHKRTVTDNNVTTTDELQIYHDKNASGPVRYSEYYSASSTLENRVNGTVVRNTTSNGQFTANNKRLGVDSVAYGSSGSPQKGVLTIDTTALSAAATALFAAPNDNFPFVNNQTFTYDGGTGNKPRTFDGTFNGVEGRYNCSAGPCTVARGNAGNFTFTGTWKFTPTANPNEILLPGLDHDLDYLVFGYWVQTVEQPGRDTTYKIGAIRTGSKPFGRNTNSPGTGEQQGGADNTAIAALMGKATYRGRAAGKYGLNVLDQSGRVIRSSAGSFTARTTLTAQFGDPNNDVPPNDQFAINGTVTGFKDPQNADTDLSDWSVVLQRAKFGFIVGSSVRPGEESNAFPLGTNPLAGGNTTGMTGTTPSPSNGNWNGQFFGPTGSGGAASSTYPTGVTGAFKANFTNGDVIGAFGATLRE